MQSLSPNGSPVIGFRHAWGMGESWGSPAFRPDLQGSVEKAAPNETRTVLAAQRVRRGGSWSITTTPASLRIA